MTGDERAERTERLMADRVARGLPPMINDPAVLTLLAAAVLSQRSTRSTTA